jgi:predicted DCC family thiol-disulfide oxidoreductase YuxK
MQSVILFDGLCNLCNGAVQFVIKRDKKNSFHFASLQSDYAAEKMIQFDIKPAQLESIILLEDGKLYKRSTAALRVARKLNGLWPLLYGFIIVPRFIRDAVYNYIAKNRYKWFGKQESCWVPTPALKRRFYP